MQFNIKAFLVISPKSQISSNFYLHTFDVNRNIYITFSDRIDLKI